MNNFRLLPAVLLLLATAGSSPAGTLLRFHTSIGDVDVELYDADKPVTVQNFLTYVQGGYFNNMFMHRVVPDFVIQGGGFNVAGLGTASPDVTNVFTLPPITNEFNVGPFYSNVYGTIAMAKTSDPNSATSQFFFNLADNSSSLDSTNNSGGFTVFGHVVGGTNVLNNFLVGTNNTVIKEANLGSPFNELPILYSANLGSGVTFADLIYVNVGPPYTPLKATYTGLSAPPDSVPGGVPGFITLTTTTASKLTGTLRLGNTRYSFSGTVDSAGHASVLAKSGGLEPLVLSLRTDLTLGSDKLLGSLVSSNWVTTVTAYRAPFDGRTTVATKYSGKYTLAITNSASGGSGVAALNVSVAGRVSVSGSLADGTAFTQSVPISGDGNWALFAALNGGKGSLSAWMNLTNGADQAVSGTGLWYKPALTAAKAYPAGFTNSTTLTGLRYTPPTAGTPVLSLTNYEVSFSGAGLTAPFTNGLMLKSNRLLNTSTNKLTVALALSSGLFSGTVKPPGSLVSIPFKGALFQGQNSGYGYFVGAGQSGQVWLHE